MELRDWLNQKGMRQRTLARTLGVEESAVSQVVNDVREPSSDFLLRFYLAYGQEETVRLFDLPQVPANGHNGNGHNGK